jgi:hypothetical protein
MFLVDVYVYHPLPGGNPKGEDHPARFAGKNGSQRQGTMQLKQGGASLSRKIQGERRTAALSGIIFLAQTHRADRYRGVESVAGDDL